MINFLDYLWHKWNPAFSRTDLKAAKEAEIKAGQEQIDTKTDELAATDEKVASDKQDIEDTRKLK